MTPRSHDFREQDTLGRWRASETCRYCDAFAAQAEHMACDPALKTPPARFTDTPAAGAVGGEESEESASKHWGWASILPLILIVAMLSGLCGHSHKNIMGNEICHHSHMHSPTEVVRSALAEVGVGQQFRHIGDHCN